MMIMMDLYLSWDIQLLSVSSEMYVTLFVPCLIINNALLHFSPTRTRVSEHRRNSQTQT